MTDDSPTAAQRQARGTNCVSSSSGSSDPIPVDSASSSGLIAVSAHSSVGSLPGSLEVEVSDTPMADDEIGEGGPPTEPVAEVAGPLYEAARLLETIERRRRLRDYLEAWRSTVRTTTSGDQVQSMRATTTVATGPSA